MVLEHILLFFFWMLYYSLHSFLASHWVKSRVRLTPKLYRIYYSSIATVLFILLMLYTAATYSVLIFAPGPISTYIGLMLTTVGIFILKRSFRNYNFKKFIGLKEEESSMLKTTGIQAKIRHPLYSGTLLIFIGYFIFNPQLTNLIMLLSLFIYLPVGIRLEEKKLIDTFGEDYLRYKEKTPSLIPKLKFRST